MSAGLDQPLAETPVSKDKWVSSQAAFLTYPPMPDEFADSSAQLLFGGTNQVKYDDPEIQGGNIALIVEKASTLVQQPPNSLDRMHASLPKQVAYNQRILKAGEEIGGRFRVNWYVCGKRPPSQNLGGNIFPPRRFSYPRRFSTFNGTTGIFGPHAVPRLPALRAVVR
jgi:hypothetical protein